MRDDGLVRAIVILLGLACTTAASAEPPIVLRMASVAPDGSGWARELKALSRELEQSTGGQVRMKWYLGAIAGGDLEAGNRIERGQLDGAAGGVWQCERWAPSMRVTRLPGLFRNDAELRYVATRLRPLFEEEFRKAGYVNLGVAVVGPSMIFLRNPVHRFDELRRVKLWSLKDDITKLKLLGALGLTIVPESFDRSRAAYDEGRVDGFLAPPTGALAFQWSTQTRYLLDVVTDDILGCVVMTMSAYDQLSLDERRALTAAMGTFAVRFDDVTTHTDEQLVGGGLFEKQGLQIIHADAQFRADFERAAHEAWKSGGDLVPAKLLADVHAMLQEYRAQPH
jgi:TRAP-type C4-dicarboxylate transport system substrate-binding protein